MKIERLGNVCNFQGGTQPPKDEWVNNPKDGYIRMLQIRDFTQGKSQHIEYVKLSNKLNTCKEVDILIGRYGASIGKILTGLSGAYNVAMIKTIPDKKQLSKNYLYQVLISASFQNFIKNIGGRAAQAGFNKEEIENYKIYLPSLEDQRKIATILGNVEALIKQRKESIALLDVYLKSVFWEMFGDPVRNEKGSSTISLGKLGVWKCGGTPLRNKKEYFNGDIPWVTSGELNDMYLFDSKEKITTNAIINSNTSLIDKDSLLLGMYDTAALKSSINKNVITCNQAIAFAKLDDKICNTLFVYFNIQIGKDFYKSQQRGVRQKNMNLSMVKGLKILHPSVTSQNKFAQIVQTSETVKTQYQNSLHELENLFSSLSQKAFKGELHLKSVKEIGAFMS